MKGHKIVFFVSVMGVLCNATVAQDTLSPKQLWWKSVRLNTITELRSSYAWENQELQKLEYLLVPELELPVSKKARLVIISRFYAEATDRLEPGEPEQAAISDWSQRYALNNYMELELREFYVDWKIKKHYITFGKQQIVWGKADGLKILDVVNPMNFREFLLDDFDNSRIPLWSLKLDLKLGNVNIQPVWILDQSYHDVPSQDATFFPSALFPLQESSIPVRSVPLSRPNRIIEDSDAGVKLSSFIKGWEFTVNYLYHYDDFPLLNSALLVNDGLPVLQVQPEYRRHHLAGGTFNNAMGKFTLRGELGYAYQKAFNAEKGIAITDQFIGVLGVDYSGISNTQLSAQVFQDHLVSEIDPVGRKTAETFASLLWSRNAMNDRLTTSIIVIQSFVHGDGFLKPAIKYLIGNSLYGTLGASIFYGNQQAQFGQFRDQNRVTIALELGL